MRSFASQRLAGFVGGRLAEAVEERPRYVRRGRVSAASVSLAKSMALSDSRISRAKCRVAVNFLVLRVFRAQALRHGPAPAVARIAFCGSFSASAFSLQSLRVLVLHATRAAN